MNKSKFDINVGEQNDKTSPIFRQQTPILTIKDDSLDRKKYSTKLARAIKSWKGRESLIIGLHGFWGSGKTSIKNMVMEILNSEPKEALPIVEFNPWEWASQKQIAESFFNELSIALGRPDHGKKNKQAVKTIKLLAARLKMGAFIAGSLARAIPFFFFLIALLGLASWLTSATARVIQGCIGIFAFLAWGAFKLSERFSSLLVGVFEANGENLNKSLEEIKAELTSLLSKREKPILIVMDDVDRLFPEDIKLLLQIIKCNADFPNLVYLLIYQRDLVEKQLGNLLPSNNDAKEFLEKIVQVGIHIPQIERKHIDEILFSGLNEHLDDVSVSKHFDQERWMNIYVGGLQHYFKNLRDVYRFLSSLAFQVNLFKQDGVFEVNPIDLISLEVLRVFEPAIYEKLPSLKVELTEGEGEYEPVKTKRKQNLHSLLDLASNDHKDQVLEILKKLFPNAEWAFGGVSRGAGSEAEWLEKLYVGASEFFNKYFIFTTPAGDVAQADIEEILLKTNNHGALLKKMRSLAKQGLLNALLSRLDYAYKEKIDISHAGTFVRSLLDIEDELSYLPFRDRYGVGPDMHICRIILWYLKQEKNVEKRAQILIAATKDSTGLFLPVMNTALELDVSRENREERARPISDESKNILKRICLEKIENAARDGRLKSHPKMAYILYRWKEWGGDPRPKEWVTELLKSQEGVLNFLSAFVRSTKTWRGDSRFGKITNGHVLKDLEEFVKIEYLEEAVISISSNNFSDDERKLIDSFHMAIKRRQEGKPESDFIRDED